MKTLYYCKRTGGKNKFEVEEKWFYEVGELNRHEFNNNRTEHRRHEEANENKVYDCYLCISAERAYFKTVREQEHQALMERLYLALDELTDKQLHLIKRIYFEGAKAVDVANERGISRASISYALQGIYKKLRKNLGK